MKPATSISQCSPYSTPSILPQWVVAFYCYLFCDVFFTYWKYRKKVENGGQIVYDGIWSCKLELFLLCLCCISNNYSLDIYFYIVIVNNSRFEMLCFLYV